MQANEYISKKGHQILLIMTFVSFVLAVSSFAFSCVKIYNESISEIQQDLEREANYVNTDKLSFGIYVLTPAPIAPFLILAEVFLTFITFLFLLKPGKFFLSSFSTILSFLLFVFWFVSTRYLVLGITDSPKPQGLEGILTHSNGFDFILLFFVSILLFWQISILLRMLIKTMQRKSELP